MYIYIYIHACIFIYTQDSCVYWLFVHLSIHLSVCLFISVCIYIEAQTERDKGIDRSPLPKVEGLTSVKKPVIELKNVSFRCAETSDPVCFFFKP